MSVWDSILTIKNKVTNLSTDCSFISVKLGVNNCQIEFDQHLDQSTFTIGLDSQFMDIHNFIKSSHLNVEICGSLDLNEDERNILSLYLPFALLPYYAKKENKCFAISHFAQTLDGRIASVSGDSKWIGNEENLVHAHRMRALCDGILIGSKTLHIDDPRLNVRLVKGSNPTKVLLGGDELSLKEYQACDESIIRFCKKKVESTGFPGETIQVDQHDAYNTQHILNCLYQRGIFSVYIEGGAFTTSNFLKENSLDQVQLHFSSKILGSGTNSFAFDGIFNMKQAINFQNGKFIQMGNEMMFIGNLAPTNK